MRIAFIGAVVVVLTAALLVALLSGGEHESVHADGRAGQAPALAGPDALDLDAALLADRPLLVAMGREPASAPSPVAAVADPMPTPADPASSFPAPSSPVSSAPVPSDKGPTDQAPGPGVGDGLEAAAQPDRGVGEPGPGTPDDAPVSLPADPQTRDPLVSDPPSSSPQPTALAPPASQPGDPAPSDPNPSSPEPVPADPPQADPSEPAPATGATGAAGAAGATGASGGTDPGRGPSGQEAAERLEGQQPAPATPTFDVVRISRGGTGVLAGRAMPGAAVTVLEDDMPLGTVKADARGEWVMILEDPLAPGTMQFALTATLADREPVASADVVVLNLPANGDDPNRFQPSEREGVVAVLSPRDGDGPSRVLQKPGGAVPADLAGDLSVETVDFGTDRLPLISGRAPAGASVAVYLDNRFLAATRAGDDGVWRVSADTSLDQGGHQIRVDQLVDEGVVALRIEQPFSVAAPPADAAGVQVHEGDKLWAVVRPAQSGADGLRYTLVFRANSDQITDPEVIYPGQLFPAATAEAPSRAG